MCDTMVSVDAGGVPLDPQLVAKLDAFRRAAHALEEYVETRNDIAALHDLAAGVNRKLSNYALREANETIPPIAPDPDPRPHHGGMGGPC